MTPSIGWVRQYLGDFKVEEISVEKQFVIDHDYMARLRAAFPEAKIQPAWYGRFIP
jgi:hypothetical protein